MNYYKNQIVQKALEKIQNTLDFMLSDDSNSVNNPLMNYIHIKSDRINKLEVLPSFHSCEVYKGMQIIEKGVFEPMYGDALSKDFGKRLLYFFYGKPSYPVSEKIKEAQSEISYLPICFIFDTDKIPIYKMYPFDTGAYKMNKYKKYFQRNVELKDYELNNNISTLQLYISALFGTNENYIRGECIRGSSRNSSIQMLLEMLNEKGPTSIDERSHTLEIIAAEQVKLNESVGCVIMPSRLLRSKGIIDILEACRITIKTYYERSLVVPNKYNEAVFELALDYIREPHYEKL